jgi:alpha-galactosidase
MTITKIKTTNTCNLINLLVAFILVSVNAGAQVKTKENKLISPVPPMGWITWNYFADKFNEKDIRDMADAMEQSGMVKAGYNYIILDDGWQGGRDNRNHIIADQNKFPSGIKALADYIHGKGMKLGIYSDAAPLTCEGYTASLNFEDQDAKTFASWEIDYLKYDYCNAPDDMETAKTRYRKMGDALRNSGRDIAFGICEWGQRKPWLWAAAAGGQVWRTTLDVRDKWKAKPNETGEGLMNIFDQSLPLDQYSGPGHWNDMDMLVVGLYGKKGPSGNLGGTGCTDAEYQSQMSLWSMLGSPLFTSNDIRNMNAETKRILLNPEVIAINQDSLGKQGVMKVNNETWTVVFKPLANGDYALAILNRSDNALESDLEFSALGLNGKYLVRDLWEHKDAGGGKKWKNKVNSHETKLLRLKKLR